MPSKTIALVANTTWNIHNFRLNVIRRLLDEGHEVIVIAPVDEYISYQEKFRSVRHIPIHRLRRDSINPVKDIQLLSELYRVYRQTRPDLIVHYTVKPNIYGGLAARLAGIPSIAVVTGLGYAFIHNGIVKNTTKYLYKLSSRFHRKIVFENSDDKQLFIEQRLITPAKGVSVMGCGVDTAYFNPEAGRNGSETGTVFTFIGRLLYDKGIREFVEAAHMVKQSAPDAKFWVVGELDRDNPSSIRREDLVQWVKDQTVEYHGATHDVRPFLQKTHCLVLPSYREGMSRVIMEAMSMERPVITTDTAGCREAVDHQQNGFLIPVKDSQALARAMQEFLQLSAERRQAMGVAGREKAVRLFDDKRVANQIYQIMQSALDA
ncbi:MAG: glycosyltransferase family 4 protein [Saprospiraceae bacterium]|nr:glycosyltransferase family 4 protein [Saprospiraceae bacterium]